MRSAVILDRLLKNNKCRRFYSYLRHIVYFSDDDLCQSALDCVRQCIHQDIIQQG